MALLKPNNDCIKECSLKTPHIRVGRGGGGGGGGSKIAPKKGRYRVGQGRQVDQKWPKNEGHH